jgi:hypothetical protein
MKAPLPTRPLTPPEAAALLPRRRLMLASLAGFGGLGLASAAGAKTLLVPDDVLEDFQRFLGGRDPLRLRDFGGAHSRRDVVEVALLLQAVAEPRPDWDQQFSLQAMPTDARLKLELRAGRALCSSTTYWSVDLLDPREPLLVSAPMVLDGEFEAGLYTLPSNTKALAARDLDAVRGLSLLSSRNWRVDWTTLEQLGVRRLLHVGNWRQMPRMLAHGRADALLAPFQLGDDMALQAEGLRLVPIPGIKIALRGTRHYLISRLHPHGAAFRERLDAGIAQLRRQGLLQQAYQQSGFFNRQVRNWQTL